MFITLKSRDQWRLAQTQDELVQLISREFAVFPGQRHWLALSPHSSSPFLFSSQDYYLPQNSVPPNHPLLPSVPTCWEPSSVACSKTCR